MSRESPEGDKRDSSARMIIDLDQWQKVQDLFADIVGANICLFDLCAQYISRPSFVTPIASDFVLPYDSSGREPRFSGALDAYNHWFAKKGRHYRSPYGFHYHAAEIRQGDRLQGVIVLGPVVLGKRKSQLEYLELCRRHNLDENRFLDLIREVKVFSSNGIRVIREFLEELTKCWVEMGAQKHNGHDLTASALKQSDRYFSVVYSDQLANYLLDIAIEVVGADSGSVLFLDEGQGAFFVKTARGMSADVFRTTRVKAQEGVAGWVAERNEPVLIDSGLKSDVLKKRLKRPQIKSSMVIPLRSNDQMMGILCLNAKSRNKQFSRVNLTLMDKLGKMAGVALSRRDLN